MGFFFTLILIFFSCFFFHFSEIYFLVSMSFIYFLFLGYFYESFFFSLELLNWFLLLLSILILSFMFLGNISFFMDFFYKRNMVVLLVFLLMSIYVLFFCNSMLMFYVFFEFSILPIFFLICGWGFNMERFSAAFYMMIYTLFFSLPFLVFLCFMFYDLKTLSFSVSLYFYESKLDIITCMFSLLMFFVKLPSFFLHLWLPSAHVEAPVVGSMVLAGLLLKLGSFGLLIYLPFIFFEIFYYLDFIICWGILGGIMAGFVCFCQVDLKKMIAYMSIMHMGIIMSSTFTFYDISFWGILLMMLAHGFSSSGMFFMLNLFYERLFSRSIFLLKGGGIFISGALLWIFLIICSNISVPPSMNFFSELFLMFSVGFFSFEMMIILLVLMFLGSICSFHMYVSLVHGINMSGYFFEDLKMREHFILYFHLIPIVFSFLFF